MMTPKVSLPAVAVTMAFAFAGWQVTAQDGPRGWLSWRGPQQNGTSLETGLPDQVDPAAAGSWSYELKGRGTPVIANGSVYTLGYGGDGKDLRERIVCLDSATGEKRWEYRFVEYPTDIIYHRFSIGSPTIDPETGNVYCLSASGLLHCFTPGGELVWQKALMGEYGRLSFPNGRTGAPLIDGELCIIHQPTANWGPMSPARDRFYAFDKRTGVSIWSSTPGGPPKDASFSMPVVATEDGRRVLYAGLAGGHLVCVDVRTGDPIWRFQMSIGGMSSSPVLHGSSIIATHGKENIDSSTIGRMVSIKRGARPDGDAPLVLDRSAENWRNDIVAFTSSPVLVGDRIYQTVLTGDLYCVDAESGEKLWHKKLAPDQIHASPVWADGKLYVPMNNGTLHIVRPSDDGPEVLQELQLEGNCLGAPAIADGRIFVHTTERLYCFAGSKRQLLPGMFVATPRGEGPITRLQVVPSDLVVQQGDTVAFHVRGLDALGRVVEGRAGGAEWKLPPSFAKGGVAIGGDGGLTVARGANPGVGIITATAKGIIGSARLRIVPALPHSDDFEDVVLKPSPANPDVLSGPARSYWVSAGKKWEVLELEGDKVLARTLKIPLFQRTVSPIGLPSMSNYTMQVDVRTDGNRRIKSSAGVVIQGYQVVLKGNHQQLEVATNQELLKEHVPFSWKPKAWYRLKARVETRPDGAAVIRAKAWPRDDKEPDAWTIEVVHENGHQHGSPGLYGFTPQSRFRVYIDNLSVIPND